LKNVDVHPEEFIIQKVDDESYNGPISFNDQVILKTWKYLNITYNSKSEIIVEENNDNDKNRMKKFIIVNPDEFTENNVKSKYVSINQKVMFRSIFEE